MKRWHHIAFLNLAGLFAMAVAVGVLRLLREAVLAGHFAPVDRPVMEWVHHHTPAVFHNALFFVSHVIAIEVLVPALAAILLALKWRGHWREAVGLLSAVLVPAVLVPVSKLVFQQPRPVVPWALAQEPSFSYPSGHAAFSLVIYGMLAYLSGRLWPHSWVRIPAGAAATALIVATGYSRVYLGVHFPSDIVAGYAVGLIWLAASIGATETLDRLYPSAAAQA